MAGDRHGKHNTTTISFRVNSYEKATIEERVKVSGMKKQDYIVRSCIYNYVCVVGKKETIEIIRSENEGNKFGFGGCGKRFEVRKTTNFRTSSG